MRTTAQELADSGGQVDGAVTEAIVVTLARAEALLI